MIRRFAPFVLFLLLFTACAGADRVALDAGDESLTREELLLLTESIQGVEAGVVLASNDTATSFGVRTVGTFFMRTEAFMDFFEAEGIEIPADLRAAAQDQVIDSSESGTIVPLEFQQRPFEALVDILVVQAMLANNQLGTIDSTLDEDFPFQNEIFAQVGEGFSVESRLGEWDSERFVIVAP